jgi:hypothetical protein
VTPEEDEPTVILSRIDAPTNGFRSTPVKPASSSTRLASLPYSPRSAHCR